MANTRITNLPAAATVTATDLLVVVDPTVVPAVGKKVEASYLSTLAPVQTVSEKTGEVALAISDVTDLQDALDNKLTADNYISFAWATRTISGTVNNYVVSPTNMLRLNTSATASITGFSGGSATAWHRIINISTSNIVIRHQDAASSPSNRIILPGGLDRTVRPNQDAIFFYDVITQRWRSPGCPVVVTA
jgi:hypothetical protein